MNQTGYLVLNKKSDIQTPNIYLASFGADQIE